MTRVVHQLGELFWFFWGGLKLGFAHVNATLGLAIALFAVWKMSRLQRLWAIALMATVAHLVAEVLVPVLANIAPLRLPRGLLTLAYWHSALALYLGYVLIIAIFFAGKRALVQGVTRSH